MERFISLTPSQKVKFYMQSELIEKLKGIGLLSNERLDLGTVPTGNYALNKICSGDYKKGIPIGGITQFHGESSSAKTVFATHILREAQRLGYWTILVDSENAYSADFAQILGLDPDRLIYSAPDTLEDCFDYIEKTFLAIRENDCETPIVVVYDSIAVSPSKAEFEAEDYDGSPIDGAKRALKCGSSLRKLNPKLRKNKVALVVINQLRSKVGVLFGSPDTTAGGGRSLEFYLSLNFKTISNKTSDLIKSDSDAVLGIKGKLRNTKNKCTIPFQETEFKLLFDKGLDPYTGLLKKLIEDGTLEKNGGWYTILSTGEKFQKKLFDSSIDDPGETLFDPIRKLIGTFS